MIAAGTRRVAHVEKNDQTGKWPAVSRHLQTGGHVNWVNWVNWVNLNMLDIA